MIKSDDCRARKNVKGEIVGPSAMSPENASAGEERIGGCGGGHPPTDTMTLSVDGSAFRVRAPGDARDSRSPRVSRRSGRSFGRQEFPSPPPHITAAILAPLADAIKYARAGGAALKISYSVRGLLG
jgi:hypothetical protein